MAYPKGRPHSDEARAKMRAAQADHPQRGRVVSDEAREKIRAAATGRKATDEARQRISEGMRGRKLPDAWRKASGDGNRAAYAEGRRSPARATWKHTDEARAHMSVASRKRRLSEDGRASLCAARQAQWATLSPEDRAARLARWHSYPPHYSDTGIERMVRVVLDSLGVAYVTQKPLGCYWVDFYVPNWRLVLECDGDYWHASPKQRAYDERRDGWMQKHGYVVRRILGSAILADVDGAVRSALAGLL